MTDNSLIVGNSAEEDNINPYFFWGNIKKGKITQSDMKHFVIMPRETASKWQNIVNSKKEKK